MALSLRAKTILGTATIEGVLLLALVLTATKFMTSTVNENTVKRAQTAATLFSTTTKDAVLSYDLASLQSFVGEVLNNPDIEYARVVSTSGDVFAQAGRTDLLSKLFQPDLDINAVDDGVFDTYAEISESGVVYGRVEIGLGISSMQASIAGITRWTASIAIIEIVLVGIFSYFLGSYLTRTLASFGRATERIANSVGSGDFTQARLRKRGDIEMDVLVESFNGLIDALESENERTLSFQQALKDLNANLEYKVASRTRELAQKNQQLQQVNIDFKATQRQLLQSEKMASVGQLAAGVAHEINNPIGYVRSNVGVMHDYAKVYISLSRKIKEYQEAVWAENTPAIETKLNVLREFLKDNDLQYISKDMFELLKDIQEGIDRVSGIVQSLKSFSRVDTDEKQEFDVNRCIETTAKMVKAEVSKHAELNLLFGNVPPVIINVGKINQVITNLLLNAAQAMEEFGRVTVRSSIKDRFVMIQVFDTGKGMTEETMKNIFNPFFTTKPEGEGTGLGLSISYEIAQEHGGSLSVQSKLGKGTCFTLMLPINHTSKENVA